MIHLNAILLTINSCYPSGPDKSQLAMETDKSSSFLIIIITVCFRWWAGCVDTEGKVSGSLHKHPTWKLCMPVPSGATGLRQPRFWLRGLLPGHGDNNNSNVSDWITNSRLLTRIGASLSKSKKKKKKKRLYAKPYCSPWRKIKRTVPLMQVDVIHQLPSCRFACMSSCHAHGAALFFCFDRVTTTANRHKS